MFADSFNRSRTLCFIQNVKQGFFVFQKIKGSDAKWSMYGIIDRQNMKEQYSISNQTVICYNQN